MLSSKQDCCNLKGWAYCAGTRYIYECVSKSQERGTSHYNGKDLLPLSERLNGSFDMVEIGYRNHMLPLHASHR
jgi:hypothetical protein